ncbi:hypothetical protein QZH41_002731, partial [Actinostola sp. cb2023]
EKKLCECDHREKKLGVCVPREKKLCECDHREKKLGVCVPREKKLCECDHREKKLGVCIPREKKLCECDHREKKLGVCVPREKKLCECDHREKKRGVCVPRERSCVNVSPEKRSWVYVSPENGTWVYVTPEKRSGVCLGDARDQYMGVSVTGPGTSTWAGEKKLCECDHREKKLGVCVPREKKLCECDHREKKLGVCVPREKKLCECDHREKKLGVCVPREKKLCECDHREKKRGVCVPRERSCVNVSPENGTWVYVTPEKRSGESVIQKLQRELKELKDSANITLVDNAIVSLQQLIARPAGLFDPYAVLAALEQVVNVAKDKNDARSGRFNVILRQCRPLINSPALRSILTKLVASKEEAEVAKVVDKAMKNSTAVRRNVAYGGQQTFYRRRQTQRAGGGNRSAVSDYSRNHKGALLFSVDIDRYLYKERSACAVIGPFSTNPFSCQFAVSPLNSVPKADSEERRIIVNDGISSSRYLDEDISLVYPTVDSIASLIRASGPGALIYKRDLRRAYRQFPVDPFDYPLLGYRWNDELYFDVVLPMGLRSAAMACQRITNAVCFICRSEGHGIISYLDDFIGVSEPASAWKSFNYCGSILEELGLEESLNKVCEPATVVTCLGVQFDTTQMTMSVTPQRLAEIEALLVSWLTKKTATKADLQSLVGKLSFVSKCVRQSRLFLSRILAVLCTLKRNHHRTRLTREFRRDLTWWLRFLRTYNGVSLIRSSPWSAPDIVFSTDACLTGCGGVSHSQYFHATFPAEAQSQFADIHRLEALAILVALRLWGHSWTGLRMQVFCDNQAVVSALSSGKVKDQLLAACLRDI